MMGVDAARPSAAPEAVQQVAALRPLLSAMQRPQPQARHPLQLLKHSSGGWTAFASAAGEGTGAGKGDGGLLRLPRLPPLLSSPPLPSPLLSSPPLPSPHVLPPPGAIDEKHCSSHHGSSFEVTLQSLEEAAMAVAAWLLQPGEAARREHGNYLEARTL